MILRKGRKWINPKDVEPLLEPKKLASAGVVADPAGIVADPSNAAALFYKLSTRPIKGFGRDILASVSKLGHFTGFLNAGDDDDGKFGAVLLNMEPTKLASPGTADPSNAAALPAKGFALSYTVFCSPN